MAKQTDTTPTGTEPSSPEVQPTQPSRPMKQQARAIQARWAGEEAAESDLRLHFESIPLDKALALLGKMRANCTIAGTIINSRINAPADQKCEVCKLPHSEMMKRKPDWWCN